MLVAQSCLTRCDPMDYSLPGSSVHEILQTGILEWQSFPSPGDLPNPGIEPRSPPLQTDSLMSEPLGKPQTGQSVTTILGLNPSSEQTPAWESSLPPPLLVFINKVLLTHTNSLSYLLFQCYNGRTEQLWQRSNPELLAIRTLQRKFPGSSFRQKVRL